MLITDKGRLTQIPAFFRIPDLVPAASRFPLLMQEVFCCLHIFPYLTDLAHGSFLSSPGTRYLTSS